MHINAFQREGGVPGEEGEKLDFAATLIDLFPRLRGKLLVDDEELEGANDHEDDSDGGGEGQGQEQGEEGGDNEEGTDGAIRRAEGRYSRTNAANTLLTTLQAMINREGQSLSQSQQQQQHGKGPWEKTPGEVLTPQKRGIEALRYALEIAQQQQQQQRQAAVKGSVILSPRYNVLSTHPLTYHLLHPLFPNAPSSIHSITLQTLSPSNTPPPPSLPPSLVVPCQNTVAH